MKTFKSFRSISVSFLTISVMLLTLACGDDSDDGESNGTGGSPTATGGSAGGASGTGGSAGDGTTGTGGTGGGGMEADAGQADGATPEPLPQNVAEGGECTLTTMLFTSKGTCQSSPNCPGGLPTQFDLSGIDPMIASLLPPPANDQANCASGLTCCIGTDQCQAVSDALAGNTMIQDMLAAASGTLSIECVTTGTCAAADPSNSFGEIPTGCPSGQSCCINVPELTPTTTTDASAPAADAGAQQ